MVGALHFIFQRNRLGLIYLLANEIPVRRVLAAAAGATFLFLALPGVAGLFSLILECLRTGLIRDVLLLLFFVFFVFVVVVVVSHLTNPS